jgi:hypothetical protein
MRAFVFALLLVAGCSSPDNMQLLPIGNFCASDNDCGTHPFTCRLEVGGYCTKPCTVDADCPMDSLCDNTLCRRVCASNDQCRANYDCRVESTKSPVCLPAQ